MGIVQLLTIVSTAILTSITGLFIAAIRLNWKAFKTIQASQKALIKDRIIQVHDQYCRKGSIGKYMFSTVETLYDEYVTLDGNGFVKGMMDELRALRIE